MVFPLFVIALVWAKYEAADANPLEGKLVNLKFFGREYSSHSSKLIAGLMFLMMGIVNIYVGLSGRMIPAPGSSVIGAMQANFQKALLTAFSGLLLGPLLIFEVTVLISAFAIIAIWFSRRR